MPAPADEFFVDVRAVRRAFDRAAPTFDAAAAVHSEIRARLMERLDVVRLQPERVLDLGAATGHGARALQDRYPRAQVIAFDLSSRMLRQSKRQQRWLRRFQRVAGDAHRLPLRDLSIDMIFSNLMLQWSSDPDAVLNEARRVIRPQGLFTFATLGPDTLKELRGAWSQVDGHTHVHRFIDMHDLGDALMRAGFAEPVMDTQRLTITYADPKTLLRELRDTGSSNLAQGRRRGLAGRRIAKSFEEQHAQTVQDARWPITLELVFGHAWAGEPRSPVRRGESRVPVSSIGKRG
jgi:malonyl-CoA O-methyltransferase